MNIKRLTLQNTLAIALLLIGIIGVALVFATDYTYRQLAFEQQRHSVSQLLALKSADLIKQLSEQQNALGLKLQSETEFTRAFDAKNIKDMAYRLDQEFNRHDATTGLIKREKIIVYDDSFRYISSSNFGIDMLSTEALPCSQIISHIKSLPGAQRRQPESQLCTADTTLFS